MKTIISIVILYFAGVCLSTAVNGQTSDALTAESHCLAYLKLITVARLPDGAVLMQRTNYSADPGYAKRSAALIQNTLGGRITFKQFHHLPFKVVFSDREVVANLFVFRFEDANKLRKYLNERPAGVIGKRGVLTAKAPQQFEALANDDCLFVLLVDGVRTNAVTDQLFKELKLLTSEKNKP